MEFLSPIWLYAMIFPLILAVMAGFAFRKYNRRWNAFVSDPRLAERLVERKSPITWWITTILILFSLIFLFLSLAEPVNGKTQVDLPTTGKKIYLAVDLSRSMLVEDIPPNRLTKAKTLAIEIIEAFPTEKIGLISFAGKAWLEAPLTTDHNVLQEALLSMNENSIPYGGSDSAPLFELVRELEDNEKSKKQSEALLVILSDGEFHNEPSQSEIRKTNDSGFTIFTIGVGTSAGGIVPDDRQNDGYFRDRRGRTVNSTLKTEPLEKIALFGNGRSFLDRNYDFVPTLKNAISILSGESTTAKSLVTYNHLYQYFLTPAILLLILATLTPTLWKIMKHIIPVTIIGFCFLSPEAHAQGTFVSYQQGNSLLEKEQYDNAIQECESQLPNAKGENKKKLNFSKGTAEYKSEKYKEAINSFSESLLSDDKDLQTESHYNLGNTIYQNGEQKLADLIKFDENKRPPTLEDIIETRASVIQEWESSLGHYRGSLHLTPDHTNARENYDYVKKKLDQLKKEQQEMMEALQKMQEQSGDGEGDGDCEDCKNGGQGKKGNKDGMTPEELREELKKGREQDGESGPNGDEQESQGGEKDEQPGGEKGDQQEREYGQEEKDEARKKLEEGSDFESGNLRTNRKRYFSTPSKNW